ncbi:hypothetical protein COCSUDRAFT_83480 [Coccomyxa subellipsoidea C-169]|uniref:Uncharacterized protein n=1 Tax=Coccomyxa subellipsoidea (strain C-169) TaxID=574566 RepID=I0YVV4_COCSC|nr:hypothetical protein COCSUDRAFT_83480 [Coccomyxa subellipsoidea C-169]EIE22523.1 hypothetical protein COCSUDRAFT_83480 [Coccomyxa subellipsoidea C-169]|eukprot:XP_005647067.1 hypothetical protein COCSUDRAFT_83480 [Coccomyxa subellipsoidea C-169]
MKVEAFLVGSEVSSLLLSDLQSFLSSDSEQLPQSFRQLLRLAESQEVQQSTSQLVSAAVRGAVEGASSLGEGSRDMTTKILDVLSSERGSSLLTLAISVACKSSTDAFCSNLAQAAADSGQPDMMQRLLHFAGSREGQQLSTTSIRTFVREGMEVYMEKLEGTNSWADLLAAIGKGSCSASEQRLGKQASSSGPTDSWANEVIQVVKVPEARKLMLMLAATATAEGVRGSLLGVRDVLLGQSCDSVATNGSSWLHLPQQQLYVLICIVFTVVLYLTARSRMESTIDFQG